MRGRLRGRERPRRARALVVGLVVATLGMVAGAGMVAAENDAGVIEFFLAEAKRRLPQPAAAPAPAPRLAAPVQPPRREPAAAPQRSAAVTARAPAAPALPAASGRTVCVRLCDGYFFPLGPIGSSADRPRHEAACAAACPHAPVALFRLAPGAADMGRARGPDGVLYRALPKAFAHQSRRVAGCSCQGSDNIARGIDPLRDPTLRRGDLVVGLSGARAFSGREGAFEDFRRSRALSPLARRQVDQLLAVSSREASRQAFLSRMTVVAVEPARAAGAARPAGFAALGAPRQGFAAVRTVVAPPFAAVN